MKALKINRWKRTQHFRDEKNPCWVVSAFQTIQVWSSAGMWCKATLLCCGGCRCQWGRRSPRFLRSKSLFCELNWLRATWTLAELNVYLMCDLLCPPVSSAFPSFSASLARLSLFLALHSLSVRPAGRHTACRVNVLWYTVDTLWIAAPELLIH